METIQLQGGTAQKRRPMYKILYRQPSDGRQRNLAFPAETRRAAGFELGKVQAGLDPTIRLRDASGIYRMMYVANFEEAVYVRHCFQKKTQATSAQDKAIARARYRAVREARKK